jgi:hypothetical protein
MNGEEEAWFVGVDKTYDQCMSEAASRYNSINAEHASARKAKRRNSRPRPSRRLE